MLLERTLNQLKYAPTAGARAQELGQLGYLQWLSGLRAGADYRAEASRAYLSAAPLAETEPAIAAFCELVRQSLETPLAPLDLGQAVPRRRGGARHRRLSI